MKAFIHGHATRPDGSKDSFFTISVDVKEKPLWWQERGLSYTATGYGSKIPTRLMVKFNGKWRRVYRTQYSNAATLYIGNRKDNLIVDID